LDWDRRNNERARKEEGKEREEGALQRENRLP